MRVLLVSSSARGHAIADALKRSTHNPEIIGIAPAVNPGIKALASELHVQDLMDFSAALEIAKNCKPDFAFIGPEDPIGGGLADELEAIGIPSIAPKKSLARIESSKGFARELFEKYGIDASPIFRVFTDVSDPEIESFIGGDLGGDFVVKYDGLKGGKGVKVSGEHLDSVEEGVAYAKECIEEGGSVVVEEKLIGPEFSLMSFVSGTQVIDMPAVQDHKRAYEGDTGPNTGGMGSYSDTNHSLPFLEESDLQRASEINQLTAEALMRECGEPYKGILYGGFIAVKDGVRVIEYNCRFGDPEALNILPLLETDFVDICLGIINGELSENIVSFANKATVCKYIVPESYPVSKDQGGELVTFPEIPDQARIFFGDLSEDETGLHLGGSRSAGVVGIGASLQDAVEIAQAICSAVSGPVRFRTDVGTHTLVQQRGELLKSLRCSD